MQFDQDRPNIVVIQGSINDPWTMTDSDRVKSIQESIGRTIDAVREKLPDAAIVVLGPSFDSRPGVNPGIGTYEGKMRFVADQKQVAFIDPHEGTPFIPGDLWAASMGPDSHPNQSGHDLIAAALSDRLTQVFSA